MEEAADCDVLLELKAELGVCVGVRVDKFAHIRLDRRPDLFLVGARFGNAMRSRRFAASTPNCCWACVLGASAGWDLELLVRTAPSLRRLQARAFAGVCELSGFKRGSGFELTIGRDGGATRGEALPTVVCSASSRPSGSRVYWFARFIRILVIPRRRRADVTGRVHSGL
jgi:hypothetical protein